jgi:hypothetical protein
MIIIFIGDNFLLQLGRRFFHSRLTIYHPFHTLFNLVQHKKKKLVVRWKKRHLQHDIKRFSSYSYSYALSLSLYFSQKNIQQMCFKAHTEQHHCRVNTQWVVWVFSHSFFISTIMCASVFEAFSLQFYLQLSTPNVFLINFASWRKIRKEL